MKNDLDQVPELVGDFDWALNEECFAYKECDTLMPFIQAGKAVFQVEYGGAQLAHWPRQPKVFDFAPDHFWTERLQHGWRFQQR